MHSAFRSARDGHHRRIGLLSTYPPKLCGLATFAAALEQELSASGHRVDVVRIADTRAGLSVGPSVAAELVNGAPESLRDAAAVLSQCDVAIVQHEYGIFGGPDGDEVVDLLDQVDVPTIVILHTVPLLPSAHQRDVLTAVVERADRVVVMSLAAQQRLNDLYAVDADKVVMIPHGAAIPNLALHAADPSRRVRPQLLTWGLLGPGKGIEHAIDALALVDDLTPRPRYTVAGVTHPNVFARSGDEYRHSLMQRCWSVGVAGSVTFDDTYRNVAQLTRFIASAAVVILPYDSRDQVTSGVLVDAIAAGRPVIATAFPHAVEMLSSGAGIVVPHANPAALAAAIREVLTDVDRCDAMAAEARRIAPSLSWSSVADDYVALSNRLIDRAAPVAI
jgi:glycosyltransferase involved in cell wall biosynthesis